MRTVPVPYRKCNKGRPWSEIGILSLLVQRTGLLYSLVTRNWKAENFVDSTVARHVCRCVGNFKIKYFQILRSRILCLNLIISDKSEAGALLQFAQVSFPASRGCYKWGFHVWLLRLWKVQGTLEYLTERRKKVGQSPNHVWKSPRITSMYDFEDRVLIVEEECLISMRVSKSWTSHLLSTSAEEFCSWGLLVLETHSTYLQY